MALEQKVEVCKKYFGKLTESIQDNQKTYTNFAKTYDDVVVSTGYILPKRVTEICLSELKETGKDASMLDIAAGTGMVGNEFRKAGFEGTIYGIDGCKEMVDACKYKDLYKEIKVEVLSKDRSLPYEDESQNAVICAGAMSKGHVPHECLREMVRVLKPGGILVFNASKLPNDPETKILNSVAKIMGGEMDAGRCTFIKQEPEVVNNDDPFYIWSTCSTIFCYRKN